jgi:hypothetical protein
MTLFDADGPPAPGYEAGRNLFVAIRFVSVRHHGSLVSPGQCQRHALLGGMGTE